MLNGKPIPSNAKWAILCFSTLYVLVFLSARTFYWRSLHEDALTFEKYEMHFMFSEWIVGRPTRMVYVPFLIFCVLTLVPPVLATVLYWETATSISCAA
jgi:hypothetical protein